MPFRALVTGLFVALASEASAQTFTDVSDLFQISSSTFGLGGAAVVDVDGDGRVDLAQPRDLLLQREGRFDHVSLSELGDLALGSVYGDVDGDGRLEAFVLYAEEPEILRYLPAREALGPLAEGGLNTRLGLVQGSLLFDYDRDGALDALVGNDGGVDLLFRGAGDGTFEDVSDMTLPQLPRGDYGMAAADYDRDGDDDVYVGLCRAPIENILYRNTEAVFSERAVPAGVDDPRASWGVVWFDFDNDAWLDLFVANMPGPQNGPGENGLFRNNGDGTFTDVAAAAGVAGPTEEVSWSATAADFDNDGWLDLFVINSPQPSRLYHNNGDGTFIDITAAAGLPELNGIQLASGDVNSDGWVDLFLPEDEALLFNDGGTNGWLSVELAGIASNPNGIGARVEVAAGDLAMVREITAGDGFMSQSHGLRAHFGLGTAASAEVTVRWPSGHVDMLSGVAENQAITVVEGVGRDAPPAMFALAAPSDGDVVPLGEPVTLAWEAAADADVVTYTVHLAAPDGTDATFETTEPTVEVPASALVAEGTYRWAVVARDAHSARTSLDNATFTNNPDVASEADPAAPALKVEVWPNPARGVASVRFDLSMTEAVWLEVVDMAGRQVRRIALGVRQAGSYVEALDLREMRAGAYVVRVEGARSGSISAMLTRIE
jgi:hypothetical protein